MSQLCINSFGEFFKYAFNSQRSSASNKFNLLFQELFSVEVIVNMMIYNPFDSFPQYCFLSYIQFVMVDKSNFLDLFNSTHDVIIEEYQFGKFVLRQMHINI